MELIFGATAPKLKTQLAKYPLEKGSLMLWQWDADAITRLRGRGILTDKEAIAARRRLLTKIEKKIKTSPGLESES